MRTRRPPLAVLLLLLAVPAVAGPPRIVRETLPSEILDEPRPLNVALPDGYRRDGSYPVVVLLDGDLRWFSEPATEILAVHPEVIVVGVENIDRDRDMFPRRLASRPGRGGGGAVRFLEFLTGELLPHVEEQYAAGGFRVLAGRSNSGLFVLWALTRAPDAFDGWLAGSPMVGWEPDLLRDGVKDLCDDRASLPVALYLNQGDDDYDHVVDALPDLVAELAERAPADFRWTHVVVPGGGHVPPGTLADGLSFLLPADAD